MKIFQYCFLFLLTVLHTGCELDDLVDPNNPSVDGLSENASISQLNNLVVGSLSQMRVNTAIYYDVLGVVGRDMYRISGSDPAWVADLLNGFLDDNAFYTTRPWGGRYRTIKNLNLLIEAAQNTNLLTNEEREGYLGFAKTIQAHEYLMVLNMQNENGLRIDVSDPDNLGPIVNKTEAMSFIDNLLDVANDHLSNGGTSFSFPLTSGFANFSSPASFSQFNRALSARVAAYQGDYDQVLNLLSQSFLDIGGDLNTGAFMVYSTSAGDQFNPMFLPLNNTGEVRLAHPSFISDAEVGDTRVNKAILRDEPVTATELTSSYDVFIYPSNTSSVPIIRNEELLLLYAEANILNDQFSDAVEALNVIRNAAGLADYSGNQDKESLIDEMLLQRRYSLWYEGHRWLDLRRYGRIDQLPIDRNGDIVHESFPIPQDENE